MHQMRVFELSILNNKRTMTYNLDFTHWYYVNEYVEKIIIETKTS